MVAPTSKQELLSFLGALNFYRKFISRFSVTALPLYELLKKDAIWSWSSDAQSAFIKLRDCLASTPILRTPDYKKSFTIRCDASNRACGCVLLQEHDGMLMPVLYDSKKFTSAEANWTVTEKEAFAVVWSFKRLHVYIDGAVSLEVETDHAALTSILKTKEPSGRVARWVMTLQSYKFTIRHRPGALMALPDSLSRLVPPDLEVSADLAHPSPSTSVLLLSSTFNFAIEQDKDSLVCEIRRSLRVPGVVLSAPAQALALALSPGHLELHDDILFMVPPGKRGHSFQRRAVVPEHMHSVLIKEHHDAATAGHFSWKKTYARLQPKFVWPDMYRDIRQHCSDCVICAQAKQSHRRLTGEMNAAQVGYPWRRVYTDYVGPLPLTARGNSYILVFIEDFSGWPEAFATPDSTAQTFADKVLDEIIARHDPPEEFFSDNGKSFAADGIVRLMEIVGARHLFTAHYRPQANACERSNKTIGVLLRTLASEHPADWDRYLPYVLRAMRTAVSARTGHTPYKLLYGRDHVTPIDLALGLHGDEDDQHADDFLDDITANLRVAIEEARKASDTLRLQHQVVLDKTEKTQHFLKDSYVLVEVKQHAPGVNKKLAMPFEGPFKVNSSRGNDYTLAMPSGDKVVHVQRLKPFNGKPPAPLVLANAPPTLELAVEVPKSINSLNLIGRRVAIYWPRDKVWYHGTVTRRHRKQHEVTYDDGDVLMEMLVGYAGGPKWNLLVPAPPPTTPTPKSDLKPVTQVGELSTPKSTLKPATQIGKSSTPKPALKPATQAGKPSAPKSALKPAAHVGKRPTSNSVTSSVTNLTSNSGYVGQRRPTSNHPGSVEISAAAQRPQLTPRGNRVATTLNR